MNHMELHYFKTDKNGTKYFYDWKCPRCGGAGFADKWINTGRVCYECGGTGKRTKAKIVKEYTPEYWVKLEARRQAKAKKYAEEHADEIAEQKRMAAEWMKKENIRICTEFGCGADGIGFVLTGNTYPVKEQIKENGGRWIALTWVSPVEIEGKKINATKINLNEFINEHGIIDRTDVQDIIFCIGQKNMTYAEAKETVAGWNEN